MALVDSDSIPDAENDLIRANEDYILSRLTPKMRRDVERIVLAGIKVATHSGPQGFLRNLKTSQNPAQDCGTGAANFTALMIKSENPNPTDQVLVAAAHASYILMLQALDVAAKMGTVEITPDVTAEATKATTNRILANMHVTPDKMQTAVSKVGEVTRNPQQMEAIELKIGSKRDPRAAQPTLEEEDQPAAGVQS